MRRFPLALTMGVLLATTACQGEEAKEPAVETEALDVAGPVVEALPQAEADALAFRAAWDGAAPVTASDPDTEAGLDGSFEFRQGAARDLGAGLFAFVSPGVGENGAGVVAIHYLVRTEDGFRRSDVDPLFVSAGTGGEPQWTLRTDLTPQPLVMVQARSTGSSRTCTAGVLVELTPSHPVLRAEAVPLTVEPAEGGTEGALTSTVARGSLGRDFTVQYAGASDAEVSYVFTDMGFYRAMSEPNLPDC